MALWLINYCYSFTIHAQETIKIVLKVASVNNPLLHFVLLLNGSSFCLIYKIKLNQRLDSSCFFFCVFFQTSNSFMNRTYTSTTRALLVGHNYHLALYTPLASLFVYFLLYSCFIIYIVSPSSSQTIPTHKMMRDIWNAFRFTLHSNLCLFLF